MGVLTSREASLPPSGFSLLPLFLFLHSAVPSSSLSSMMDAGHAFAQSPQPTHLFLSTLAKIPSGMEIAPLGQTKLQQPQATHCSLFTSACFFILVRLSFPFSNAILMYLSYQNGNGRSVTLSQSLLHFGKLRYNSRQNKIKESEL